MSTFSTIAHNLRHNLQTAGYSVSLGHCQQTVAVLFGFNTLAAFQASDICASDLQGVQHVVVDESRIIARTTVFGSFPNAQILRRAIAAAMEGSELRATLHNSPMHFQDYLQAELESFVEADGDVVSEMANANHDGIDELYLRFDIDEELAGPERYLSIDIEGHVGLRADNERPFSGTKINVVANISMERLSAPTFTKVEYLVVSASLDYGWSLGDDDDERPPLTSLENALSNELGITVEEAETLMDVEPEAITSDDGSMTYYYVLDFDGVATEPLRTKLLDQHGSLQIEVSMNFFDNVSRDIS